MTVVRWLPVFMILGALTPRVGEAQLELAHPSCAPDWWDEHTVAEAVDVELAGHELEARISFVVDAPCEEQTIVSVLIASPEGIRRRLIDVGDLPVSARPRAIGMGVAALMQRPPEPGSAPTTDEPPDETEEASAADAEPATVEADEAPTEVSADLTAPSGPSVEPAPAPKPPEGSGAETVDEAPHADDSPRRWLLTASATGLWTAPGSPWLGAHGSLGLRWATGWTAALGVDGARGSGSDPLGSVLGRWVSTSVTLAWHHRWPFVALGARLALALDWTRLEGRTDQEGVHTRSSSRWSAAAEVAAAVELPITERFAFHLDLGLHLSPWGLDARSPTGRVLAIRGTSGLARLGLRVLL